MVVLAIRRLAAIVMALVGSKSKIEHVWPLDGSGGKDTFTVPTPVEWRRIMARQKQVDAQIKKQKHG